MSRNQEPGLLGALLGSRWQVAAWRAVAVFVAGYVVLPLLFGHGKVGSAIQFLASALTFILTATALYGFAQSRAAEADGSAEDNVIDESISTEPAQWSPELLRTIEWKHLLELCEAVYKEKGFRNEASPLDADGNVDIRLYQAEAEQPVAIARCRAWGEPMVKVDAVQALMDAMPSAHVAKAFFITPGEFTAETRALAQGSHVVLIDGKLLFAMLGRLSGETRMALLNSATASDFTTPSCPGCGLKMMPGENEQGPLWSCRAFPRCKRTLTMRPAMV